MLKHCGGAKATSSVLSLFLFKSLSGAGIAPSMIRVCSDSMPPGLESFMGTTVAGTGSNGFKDAQMIV